MIHRESMRRSETAAPAARARGRGVTWMALLALLGLGVSGGFLAGRTWPKAAAQDAVRAGAAPAPADAAASLAAAEDLRERTLALEPFIVNLQGDEVTRYLKLRVALEAETPEARAELEARLPQVRDGILTVLGTQDVGQATSAEGRTLLKRDLEARLSGLVRSGRVRSVFFTEYVVQ